MRFRYKRPKMSDVSAELETVIDVMLSDWFIVMDLFWYSLIFTLFMFPVLHTVPVSILFFLSSYVFFNVLFFFVFKKVRKKSIDF